MVAALQTVDRDVEIEPGERDAADLNHAARERAVGRRFALRKLPLGGLGVVDDLRGHFVAADIGLFFRREVGPGIQAEDDGFQERAGALGAGELELHRSVPLGVDAYATERGVVGRMAPSTGRCKYRARQGKFRPNKEAERDSVSPSVSPGVSPGQPVKKWGPVASRPPIDPEKEVSVVYDCVACGDAFVEPFLHFRQQPHHPILAEPDPLREPSCRLKPCDMLG